MDLDVPLRMLHSLIDRLLGAVTEALPPRGEVSVWCVLRKPALHLQLGTVVYAEGRKFSDLTPHANLVTYLDPSWRRKNRPVLYGMIRTPAPQGGILYHLIDPAGGMYRFEVTNTAARAELFVHTISTLPLAAEAFRAVLGDEL